ncbi:MAG: hypothetical protein M3Z70_00460 [Bartonella sp.]|nr:hypothetical protein [Bartonella sp.]
MRVVVPVFVVVQVLVAVPMIVVALVLAAFVLGFKSIIVRCNWFLRHSKERRKKFGGLAKSRLES